MNNIWLRANQRKTRTQNHQNLTTVLLRLSKYWHILHRSATTSLQNAARNVKAENRRETAQSSWICQVYRRGHKSPEGKVWRGDRWGLNPQPLEPQSRALPIEL